MAKIKLDSVGFSLEGFEARCLGGGGRIFLSRYGDMGGFIFRALDWPVIRVLVDRVFEESVRVKEAENGQAVDEAEC